MPSGFDSGMFVSREILGYIVPGELVLLHLHSGSCLFCRRAAGGIFFSSFANIIEYNVTNSVIIMDDVAINIYIMLLNQY